MADIAKTKKAVENKNNFGTRISTDLHGLLFRVKIVVNFELSIKNFSETGFTGLIGFFIAKFKLLLLTADSRRLTQTFRFSFRLRRDTPGPKAFISCYPVDPV